METLSRCEGWPFYFVSDGQDRFRNNQVSNCTIPQHVPTGLTTQPQLRRTRQRMSREWQRLLERSVHASTRVVYLYILVCSERHSKLSDNRRKERERKMWVRSICIFCVCHALFCCHPSRCQGNKQHGAASQHSKQNTKTSGRKICKCKGVKI